MHLHDTPQGTRTIETQLEIGASVEAVWKALTDAEELTRWFPLEARVEPGPNGSISWWWGEEFHWDLQIEAWEPNERLRLVYDLPPPGADQSEGEESERAHLAVDFTLEGQEGTTILRLVHSGFGPGEEWDAWFDGTRRGWAFELRGLRHYLEHHAGTPRKIAWARTEITIPMEEAWSKLMGPEGFLAEGALENPGQGDRYAIKTADGDSFEGIVYLFSPPKDFSGTVENMDNALLRLRLDYSCQDPSRIDANLWLSGYGLPDAEVAAFEERWNARLKTLFQ